MGTNICPTAAVERESSVVSNISVALLKYRSWISESDVSEMLQFV